MAETTGISWTDSTFNPWIGCTKVSPGCDHCYASVSTPARAMRIAWGPGQPRHHTAASNWKQPRLWNREHEAFALMHGRRRRVFCASLADWLDNEAPIQWFVELMELVRTTPHLDWLMLTKRIGNWAHRVSHAMGYLDEHTPANYPLPLRAWLCHWLDGDAAPHNVWLGITVVNQAEADRDIPKLTRVPAALRWLSMEPLLGPVQLGLEGIEWVIVGGESGPHARTLRPEWVHSLRAQCQAVRVPFHFKQWGGVHAAAGGCELNGQEVKAWPNT